MPRARARPRLVAWLGLAALFVSPFARAADVTPDSGEDFFRDRVEPVLRRHCYECHSHDAGKMKGGLTLDSRSGWETGGEHGPAVVPGDPEGSLLVRAVRRVDPEAAMPPKTPLSADEVRTLENWVREGAPDPRTLSRAPGPGRNPGWWAAQAVLAPSVPSAPFAHPIDAFAAIWLHDQGRSGSLPSPAPRRVLLRRLSVTLHGLLPTPEEVADFEADPAPDAWERRVDRWLASPRYGERWARHWLDVVHFAETHGHDQDRPRDHAWPYRDYVIEAFNTDRPYSVFAAEQIAADALFPQRPELTPALGFLAAGPWDESSLRDIREDTLDREIGRYLDRDDIVANVMSTFAGVTAHCARCHDHKFDPISQQDYYALQAVFAGTEKAERLYHESPTLHHSRQYWMRLQVALDRQDLELLEAALVPELRAAQAAWEAGAIDRPVAWDTLTPDQVTTRHGTRFTALPDGSWLASGASPPTEVIEARTRTALAGLTALRLEVLPDASLPRQGPGRAENGNLHLTEIQVFARDPSATPGTGEVRVPLRNPSADFNQEAWNIAQAVDGRPETAWGIHPREGSAHQAVFELDPPPALAGRTGVVLHVVLAQEHGRQHTLGRFRLSTTRQPPPVRVSPLAPTLVEALRTPATDRTPAQKLEVATAFLGPRVRRELDALPEPRRVYAGASLFPPNGNQKPFGRPRPIHRLRRGEITQPLEEAVPGALSCVTALPARFAADADEALRRGRFAIWMTHHDNPFFWRVIVNRVWLHHFGQGLVATPNDFGRMGSAPSHPALLDWLAATFRDDFAGSLKSLHRLVLTSRTWQQPSADPLRAHPLQPVRQRLDAETFRDSVLRIDGRLDLAMGGPSARQFIMTDGIHVTPNVDYARFDLAAPANYRRSIYRFLFRTLPDPLMDAMDSPSGDQSTPQRPESFTALQAFALLHHPFVFHQAEAWAARLAATGPDLDSQVQAAFADAFQRRAEPTERSAAVAYARTHGLPELCRMLWNSNEFHFLD